MAAGALPSWRGKEGAASSAPTFAGSHSSLTVSRKRFLPTIEIIVSTPHGVFPIE
jgi:hypothetical protein